MTFSFIFGDATAKFRLNQSIQKQEFSYFLDNSHGNGTEMYSFILNVYEYLIYTEQDVLEIGQNTYTNKYVTKCAPNVGIMIIVFHKQ